MCLLLKNKFRLVNCITSNKIANTFRVFNGPIHVNYLLPVCVL